MKNKPSTRLAALGLAISLLLPSCGSGTSAATMHLRKTEGTVAVSDGENKDIAPKDNLGLYSGYRVGTQAESYAWIDLDKVKLTKMDANSEIEVVKEDKRLEINVKSGSLFFNVTEPLADDERLNIRTSSMAVGIRGTCGWVTENAAALLEGTVEVTAGDQTVTVNAGEMAGLMDGVLEVKPFTAASVPAFVREEVADDEDLAKTIQDTTGVDLTVDPMAVYEGVNHMNAIYRGVIDFQGDGNPELVVITRDSSLDDDAGEKMISTSTYVYKNKPDGPDQIGQYHTSISSTKRISLIESDGRYLLGYILEDETGESASYRSVTDGEYEWIDEVISYHYYDNETYNVILHDSDMNDIVRDNTAEEYNAIMSRYHEVKVLVYNPDGITAVAAEP